MKISSSSSSLPTASSYFWLMALLLLLSTQTQVFVKGTPLLELSDCPDDGSLLCGECQGDCTLESGQSNSCDVGLACFQRSSGDTQPIPGCMGTFVGEEDYCGDLSKCGPELCDLGGNGCNSAPNFGPCFLCQGDCDTDTDCDGDFLCWQRGFDDGDNPPDATIPGCNTDFADDDTDFCYDPTFSESPTISGAPSTSQAPSSEPTSSPSELPTPDELELEDIGDCSSSDTCGECQADCDDTDDCELGLKCFQRSSGDTVAIPGCFGSFDGGADYCMSPNGCGPLLCDFGSNGCTESDKCGECQGDCRNKHSNCEGDLRCFQRDSGDDDPLPGCDSENLRGSRDYCVQCPDLPSLCYLGDDGCGSGSGEKCGRCQGDCDSDSDCEDGLECFERSNGDTDPILGCEGEFVRGVDYCFDPNFVDSTSPPTASPTKEPTSSPTVSPTKAPTATPTVSPTASPTTSPTKAPTSSPTVSPTKAPTTPPTAFPTASPTGATSSPTESPTAKATLPPTAPPTAVTGSPTKSPTASPTTPPTGATSSPTEPPTASPTVPPTGATGSPTVTPTAFPTTPPTAPPTTGEILLGACPTTGLCGECQGDCSDDDDCEDGLKCFEREDGDTDVIPGCTGNFVAETNYCGSPEACNPALCNFGSEVCTSSNTCFGCQGDCDTDADCDGSLRCLQRESSTDITPGCDGTFSDDTDFCIDPADCSSSGGNCYFGGSGCSSSSPCGECQADCDDTDDCEGSLRCFQRSSGDTTPIPGCSENFVGGNDYCMAPENCGPVLCDFGSSGCSSSSPCGACQGDCDDSDDCELGLECFKRSSGDTDEIPGCGTNFRGGTDYCYDPTARLLRTDDKIDDRSVKKALRGN